LDRFELFFPERRQFFLENGDLFSNFGYENIRPFFSRRIGLNAPIQYGARLSGKINKDWRIGAMNMQTGAVEEKGLPSQNFSVLALQRRVFARSNIGAIFVNRESLNYEQPSDPTQPIYNQFNRNFGLEYNLASSNNLWTGKAFIFKSIVPGQEKSGTVHAANLRYFSGNLYWNWQHEIVTGDYRAEVGYVPRTDYFKINPNIGYLFFPKSRKILSHGPEFNTTFFFNSQQQKTDQITYLVYRMKFRSQSDVAVWTAYDYVLLQRPFDPTNFSGKTLKSGTSHQWNAVGAEYVSRPQSVVTYSLSSRYGGYYANGKRFNMSGELTYRYQPYFRIGLSANYNEIQLPEPWNTTTFWLIGPRIDFTLTNKIFFTSFIQYNEQINNINFNHRFQWRFKPASDLFLVFTDNYLPAPFYIKDRAVALKFTYWWNL
jgi:hypothetical protein